MARVSSSFGECNMHAESSTCLRAVVGSPANLVTDIFARLNWLECHQMDGIGQHNG